MANPIVSIIIPSRNEYFLEKTVNDLLNKATGEVEIIVVLDGMWQDNFSSEDPRVIILHHGEVHANYGMRESINKGMRLARGEFVLKADGHTMWDQGFDVKLAADCEDNWVVVPRRKRLEPESWTLVEDGRPDIDYMCISYPYKKPFDITNGLHGDIWPVTNRNDLLIDDLMSFQGSAYFMTKKHWERLGGMSTQEYGPFINEAQEIGNKTWFGGGRVIVNKKTWYAHLHKGPKYGTGYHFNREQWKQWVVNKEKGRLFAIDYWINNKWPERKHDWEWFIEKFWNFDGTGRIPSWPDNWREQLIIDEKTDWSHSDQKLWGHRG